eukprot:scaffold1173_cov405-Prasinococcus_capsulatus_cf.AAC.24
MRTRAGGPGPRARAGGHKSQTAPRPAPPLGLRCDWRGPAQRLAMTGGPRRRSAPQAAPWRDLSGTGRDRPPERRQERRVPKRVGTGLQRSPLDGPHM